MSWTADGAKRADDRSERRGGQAEAAYREIEERIVTLRIPPGTLLSEQTLARALSIGRTPIREALQRLSHHGLVHVLPHRGVFVSEIDVTRQLRMVELRREVEQLVVRAACRRGSDPQCRALDAMADQLEEAAAAEDDTRFIRLDRDMNALLYAMADNEFATRTMLLVSGLTRRFWYLVHSRKEGVSQGGVKTCALLHADIARAVARRDSHASSACVSRLLDYIEELSRAGLETLPGRARDAAADRLADIRA